MNLTFRKLVLFSVLTVLLGFSLVYALSVLYKPKGTTQTGSPPGIVPSGVTYVLVFAYEGDNASSGGSGFVQASITIAGTEYNGTTSTDLQNPLTFKLLPGMYSVLGTYGSATQNVTVKVGGGVFDAFLNFGSSPLPPLGNIWIEAWYTSKGSNNTFESGQVQASVTITGPEQHNGTTGRDPQNDLIFTVQPGDYTMFVTYGSVTQNKTVSVTAGQVSGSYFFFGDGASTPPP